MDLSYCECSVKRVGRKYMIIKYIWVLLTIYAFAFNIFYLPSLVISMLILLNIGIMILAWPSFKAEYEYIFCDGQIDFDIIKSGRKRKNLKKIDLIDAELICHIDNEKLDKYKQFEWRKSYVSGQNYANCYVIILRRGNNSHAKVTFEPDERMLNAIKNKAPRITFIEEIKQENKNDDVK